jgi:hypothetical protein
MALRRRSVCGSLLVMGDLFRILAVAVLAASSVPAASARDTSRSALVPEYATNTEALKVAYAARDFGKAITIATRQATILCELDGARSLNCAFGHSVHGSALIAAGQYEAAIKQLRAADTILVDLPGASGDERHNLAYKIDRLEALLPLLATPEGRKSTALAEIFRSLSEKFNFSDELPVKLDLFARAMTIQLAARGDHDTESIAMM